MAGQRATGRYVTSTTVGETVRAFVPAALPPDPPLDLNPLMPLLDKANQALSLIHILNVPGFSLPMASKAWRSLCSELSGMKPRSPPVAEVSGSSL